MTSKVLATTVALLVANPVTAFVQQIHPKQPASAVVRSQINDIERINEETPATFEDNDAVMTAMGVKQEQQDDEERLYYKILSEESPRRAVSAGDVLSTFSSSSTSIPINGWVPKEDYALWGLPGAIAPLGYFDPIGFAREGTPLNDAKRLREAEVQHGRVAMLATVGYFAGEWIPQGGPFHLVGPANDQLQQVPTPAFVLLAVSIAMAELNRARIGWVEPKFQIGSNTLWTLHDTYYPGDIGFDPLGLKPTENYEFQRMQTKELSNGRLAMIGWAGMCAQELMNHRMIGETLDFYQTLFNGGNPYDTYYY
jgi:hypothetical protein